MTESRVYCSYIPVIGLRFISLARSLDASCHSLVNVFGGGAATKTTHTKKKRGLDKQTRYVNKKAIVTYQIAV